MSNVNNIKKMYNAFNELEEKSITLARIYAQIKQNGLSLRLKTHFNVTDYLARRISLDAFNLDTYYRKYGQKSTLYLVKDRRKKDCWKEGIPIKMREYKKRVISEAEIAAIEKEKERRERKS